ncbi:semaphorin-7A isoform X1 [Anguilla anguilla]|uniref:semaphorin-7A isoform X1 n=1 Tax=Anguilla anguilla TaxID=7936 RepID=UPI0015A83188|nr:semaphorin-7A isoform X1 [Anguilla anguilla]
MKFQLILFFTCNLRLTLSVLDYKPRLFVRQDSDNSLWYNQSQRNTVFFHPEDSNELYVGGTNFVYRINIENGSLVENIPLTVTGDQNCKEISCENVITVIQQFQDRLFVCGTNGNKPLCWKLHPQVGNPSTQVIETYEGTGISPHIYTQNSLSLTVEGDLYTAVPLNSDGSLLQFRRKKGRRPTVWMHPGWVMEPTFISTSWVRRKEDKDQEKIYLFFREKNSDSSPDADPWISRVARVCKVDEGGPKRFFQNIWTSFLKARLVCGIPSESLYFNRLQDIYVQHADDWKDSRVYALFSSSWNSTAVCIYSMAEIDHIFESSSFKGFQGEIPEPRPGTCVPDSKTQPVSTIKALRDHPEMSDWIHPIHHQAPFYISANNYTKLAVDLVSAANGVAHSVLLLATAQGMIHKILEDDSKPFIISETLLSNHTTSVLSMNLNSKRRKLFIGFPEQISWLDLQRCQDYNGSCEECVLARDPYCAWNELGCTPVSHVDRYFSSSGGIQNILGGETSVCPKNNPACTLLPETKRPKRDALSRTQDPPGVTYSIPLGVPFYLSCPIHSHHAFYTWEYGGRSSRCQQSGTDCLHLISAMSQDSYGRYYCVSSERDYTMVVSSYQLNPSRVEKSGGVWASAQRPTVAVLVVALLATSCY